MSQLDEQFKAALSRWASGVAVVLLPTDEGVKGITISAFMSGSLNPPLVCFAINRSSDFVTRLENSERFTLNILSHDQSNDSNYWAGWSDDPDSILSEKSGQFYINGASVHMLLKHHSAHDCGDHILYIVEMIAAESYEEDPLLYYRGSYGV